MKYLLLLTLGLTLSLSACSQNPKPIHYGTDLCDFCKMTIVDKQHAAEIVTLKGKALKFDAAECMVNYINRQDPATRYAHILVNDFNDPGVLLDAQTATFLVSDAIPSPMGANLSAFKTAEAANSLVQSKGGQTFTWDAIKKELQ